LGTTPFCIEQFISSAKISAKYSMACFTTRLEM